MPARSKPLPHDEIVQLYRDGGLGIVALAARYRCRKSRVSALLIESAVMGIAVSREYERRRGTVNRVLQCRVQSLPALTDTQWAYIAGIFDGEGSLTREANRGLHYRVCISQLEGELLPWIARTVGAGYVTRQRTAEPLKRNQEQWRISKQRHVYQFLIGVWPYIIVKRLAVGTALAYFTNRYGWEA